MREIMISPPIEHGEYPDLRGKRVLIIGGTHGIGEALARDCIAMGALVTVVGRSYNDTLPCLQIQLDVVEHPELTESLFVGAHYVFNNIGEYYKATLDETTREDLQRILKVNVEIMYLLSQYSVRHALEVVVNMSSRPTLEKYHSWALYTLSKQAVITMTKAAAEEGRAKCYAICPSRVDTKFRDSVFPNEDKNTRLSPEETADAILKLFNGRNPNGGYYWIKAITE